MAAVKLVLDPMRILFAARPEVSGAQTTQARVQIEIMDKEKLELQGKLDVCEKKHPNKDYLYIHCRTEQDQVDILRKCQQAVVSPFKDAVDRDADDINIFYKTLEGLLHVDNKD